MGRGGTMSMRVRFGGVTVLALVALGAGAAPAVAHEDPPGCTTLALNLSFDPSSGLGVVHRNGDRLELAVRVRNDNPNACSVSDVTVTVTPPRPDGTPGTPETVAEGASFPAGTPPTTLQKRVSHTVDFDDSTFRGPVAIGWEGTFHGSGSDTPTGGGLSTPLVISKPHITMTVVPTVPSGPVPFGVDYTYTLENDSPVDPHPTAGDPPGLVGPTGDYSSVLNDDTCSSPQFVGGDTTVTTPRILQQGETWTFTCSHVFGAPGTFTNKAAVVGSSTRDGRPWPATEASATVTATGPDLAVTKTHEGDFVRGESGRAYALTVSNLGNQASTGTVTLRDQLPPGLAATAISGAGWSCALATLTCTRADPLAPGASYPQVTLTVDVPLHAPASLTNVAEISGGATGPAGNDVARDPTTVRPASNAFSLGKARRAGKAVVIDVTVPGAGDLTGDDAGAKNAIKRARASANGPGTVRLRLAPTRKAKRKLKAKGRLKARAAVTFEPAGGEAATQTTRIKFRRKRR